MGCNDGIPRVIVISVGVGVPIGLLVASQNIEDISEGIITGLVVGGVAGLGYLFWQCSKDGIASCTWHTFTGTFDAAFCGMEHGVVNWLEGMGINI